MIKTRFISLIIRLKSWEGAMSELGVFTEGTPIIVL